MKLNPSERRGTLFDPKTFGPARHEEEWTNDETDRLLDLYFEGTSPDRMALLLSRSLNSIRRRLQALNYNERGAATSYTPTNRKDRTGQVLTKNERLFLQGAHEHGVSSQTLARILCRRDLPGNPGSVTTKTIPNIIPLEDLCWAARYILTHYSIHVGEALRSLAEKTPQNQDHSDVPERIKSLAVYLALKEEGK